MDGDVAVYRPDHRCGVAFQVQGGIAALATTAKGDADATRAHQAYFVFAVPLFAVVGVFSRLKGDVALAGLEQGAVLADDVAANGVDVATVGNERHAVAGDVAGFDLMAFPGFVVACVAAAK